MRGNPEIDLEKPSVLVIGLGTVGKAVRKVFSWADAYDKYKGAGGYIEDKTYDFAFICVPTPSTENASCDLTAVMEAVTETDAEILVLKSTVTPGTTKMLRKGMGKRIVFSPEFYGRTQHSPGPLESGYVILGGEEEDTKAVANLYQHVFRNEDWIAQTDSTTAEMVKYMVNSYLAMKVVFGNEFYRVAERVGVNYQELRQLVTLDKRVSPQNLFVYEEAPYYDSKCLNKDVPAFVDFAENFYPADLMRAVHEINQKFMEEEGEN